MTACLSNASVSGGDYGDILIEAGTERTVGAYIIDNASKAVTEEKVTLSGSDETVAAAMAAVKEKASEALGTSSVVLNGSDSANWNGGNCDYFFYTGDITEVDLLKALPFSPMGIGVLNVTGEELLETIEAATQKENCPGFAQVSGLTYTLDTSKEYDAGEAYGDFFECDSINRVTITSVNGKDFDPAATYALVCDNFLMNGNDTYYTLKAAKEAENAVYINNGNDVKVRDAVALYIKEELKGMIGETYAQPHGRITITERSNPFTDVPEGKYYTEPVLWAYANKIVGGMTDATFEPDSNITHAQLWTILARQKGEDVSGGSPWHAKAQEWAAAEGISDGADPTADITRQELALYRFAGSPEAKGDLAAFSDAAEVAEGARDAMIWAVVEKIINGSDGKLLPAGTASRAQVVTILRRFIAE